MLALGLSACAPSLTPLYRDFEMPADSMTTAEVIPILEAALTDAGWDIAEPTTPNVVATQRKTLSEWGLYRVEAYLEAAPLGGNYVRLFVHPQRRFITGGRSKIPFLVPSLRRSILPDINEAFQKHGLQMAKSARERGLVEPS
ncbi:MAG TPA: hypothetical protein VF190_15410 [Rhodothermales bacterium]